MCMFHSRTHTHTLHTEKSKISAPAEVSTSDEAKKASRELKNLKIDMACESLKKHAKNSGDRVCSCDIGKNLI